MATLNSDVTAGKRSRKRRYVRLFAAILAIAACAAWMWLGTAILHRPGALKSYPTPAWQFRKGDQLLVRTESRVGGALLLRCLHYVESIKRDHSNDSWSRSAAAIPIVYRYDPETKSLSEVGVAEWNAAEGVIIDDEFTRPRVSGVVGFDFEARKVLCNGNPNSTAAPTVLGGDVSSDGRLMAVLSTTGSYVKPGMVFGVGGALGQRYHEVLRLSDCSRVGPVVALDYYAWSHGLSARWSADGKYVVYHDTDFSRLFIIPVETGGSQQ